MISQALRVIDKKTEYIFIVTSKRKEKIDYILLFVKINLNGAVEITI